jgi:hypothetical protein
MILINSRSCSKYNIVVIVIKKNYETTIGPHKDQNVHGGHSMLQREMI